MVNIYEKLREKLDTLAKGFPKTETGEEIEFLKYYFTPEDAEIFIAMNNDFQSPAEFAAQFGEDVDVITKKMENMARKGLLFRLRKKGEFKYHTLPVVHGIWEVNGKNVNPKIWMMFAKYYNKHLGKTWHSTETPIFRTIPINTEILAENRIVVYDDAEAILRSKRRISVTDCVCRKLMEVAGRSCNHPLETCLAFDALADYYIENNLAKDISLDEALTLIRRNEQEGLVIQVCNSKDVEMMCACCSCSCGILIALNKFDAPNRPFLSSYTCQHDGSLCISCGICIERCPVRANIMTAGELHYKEDLCIGCGLCVTTCVQGARALLRKSEDKIYEPPETLFDAYEEMAKYREKIKAFKEQD